MAQLKKATHPVEVRTVTKEGECNVNIKLEIEISLDSEGVRVGVREGDKEPEPKGTEERWAIGEFDNLPKVQFGKKT